MVGSGLTLDGSTADSWLMDDPTAPEPAAPGRPMPDWFSRYAQGETPWDRHSSGQALDRVLREWQIRPCRVLDMGCGTGDNAIRLARQGFEVTAFDLVPRAIDLALEKSRPLALNLEFRVADFRRLNPVEPFPFVFDSGLYHCVRRELLRDWLAFLERVTQPGSRWLTLTGNANEPRAVDQGPPRVRASELCAELEPLFELIELRESRFEPTDDREGWHPLAWSALLRRRAV
jgi:SAM-dependent methyltransferase